MKLLFDGCVSRFAVEAARSAGHDVTWAGDWEEDPGDEEILARAHAEGRVVVTIDKDFGELAILRGAPHHGIVRLSAMPARSQGAACVTVINQFGEELMRGAIATVEAHRVRIRSPN